MAIKRIKAYTRKDGVKVNAHTKRLFKKHKALKHTFERRKHRKDFLNWGDRSISR